MQDDMLNDQTTMYYVVRVNGEVVSPKFENRMLAEMEKQKLDPKKQAIAEVVSVTSDGSQLLLG